MNTELSLQQMKEQAPILASTTNTLRNKALEAICEALLSHKEEIFKENEADIRKATEEGLAKPILSRLKFDEHKLIDVTNGIRDMIGLPDPLYQIQLKRQLDEGLTLIRESCPIGVIGVIFEARPDALVQISCLCLKSGNCAVLKGGREAERTNHLLFTLIRDAAIAAGLPEHILLQMEEREQIAEMLQYDQYVDLLIPRGSNAFVRYIMENTKIPVMGHADGICHIYIDEDANIEKAVSIIVDAKTQYVSACNTVESLLVHEKIMPKLMPVLADALQENQVRLRADEAIRESVDCEAITPEDDRTEYLDLIVSARTVSSIEEAVLHINRYGSHHTDAIITENDEKADFFMRRVDSAGVYRNCSTRFADGYRYGFGAEVGISTGKLHARGPVGLEGLVSYKYKLIGDGHIVGDYASGKRSFHFEDL